MQPCPRQAEATMGVQLAATPHWREDRTCSYCGSIHPDDFFEAIALGCELGPTDKDYKVYVDRPNPLAGKPRIVSSCSSPYEGYRHLTEATFDEICVGMADSDRESARRWNLNHWVQVSAHSAIKQDKFYFYHLDADQQVRFIDLLNAKKLKIGYPGRFYVLPFFAKRIDPAKAGA